MARSWIFQANPKRFNLAAFASQKTDHCEWLVSRYRQQIAPGDRVYLWASAGDEQIKSGVFASARVIRGVATVADDGPAEFWSNPVDAVVAKPRARIAIQHFAKKREIIQRNWLAKDPIFHDHLIIRMANNTTFSVDGEHLKRLDRLWARTGVNWNYEDCLAGLFAFSQTRFKAVSQLPGTPVSVAALETGRPVGGMYNKVMNFRHLDPEDPRDGLPSIAKQDEVVWSKFFVPGQGLQVDALETEYRRVFHPSKEVDATIEMRTYNDEAEALASQKSIAELLTAYTTRAPSDRLRGATGACRGVYYERDPLVGAIARRRAEFRCEIPTCNLPQFNTTKGLPYIEVHHIMTLATGGDDTPGNVACLCPMHHREIHFGEASGKLTETLRALRFSEVTLTVA